ncbi:MAG: type II toxin-antitoxin system ParD family antitoxin [Candidatus Binataceae bacterium]
MNISLTPELDKLVEDRVASGGYASASEVIREALRLLRERDQLNDLRREVRRGIEQLDEGRTRLFDERAVKRIKQAGRKRVVAAPRKIRSR